MRGGWLGSRSGGVPATVDEYQALAPEKVELRDGWVFGTPDFPDERVKAIRGPIVAGRRMAPRDHGGATIVGRAGS